MNAKPQPNHRRYLDIIRAMSPAQRLEKSFELTEYSRRLMKDGIRRQNPGATEQQVHQIFVDRLLKCHRQDSQLKREISCKSSHGFGYAG